MIGSAPGRKIAVFTGTRAEYGLLRRLAANLAARPGVELSLIASGSHVSGSFGGTLWEIERDGYAPVLPVDIDLADNSPAGVGRSLGRALESYSLVLNQLRPHLLVVLGDRYETVCAVLAAAVQRLPVAHLGGGATSQGAIDELFRHAVTKMSHLHFVSSETSRRRVLQLGEDPAKVWLTGYLGLENIRELPVWPEALVRADLGLPPGRPYLLLTFHPATVEDNSAEEQLRLILAALAPYPDLALIFTGANADAGGEAVNRILQEQARTDERLRFFMSLGVERYINTARYAAGVAGNSSSGLVEVPALGVPVLDIGNRQRGRERLPAVRHCPATPEGLAQGLAGLLAPVQHRPAPQADLLRLNSSALIAERLVTHPLEGLLVKPFFLLTEKASN